MLQVEEERKLRLFKNKGILWEIFDSIRKSNIRFIGIPEREDREKGAESLYKETIAENFPNLQKEPELQTELQNQKTTELWITSMLKDFLKGI